MRCGHFYEDDEPSEDVRRAFDEGPHLVTSAGPVRGWTYWLDPNLRRLRVLTTSGAPVAVTALREAGQ